MDCAMEGDTRYRRRAATQRRARYWNAYIKSGGVTKTLVKGNSEEEEDGSVHQVFGVGKAIESMVIGIG